MAAIVPAARTAATDATWRGLISNGFPGGSRDRGRRRLMSETNPVGRAMKAVAAPNPGGPEALQVAERPVPQPGCGELLIKIAAAGLNGADLLQRQGRYPLPPGAT